MLAACGRQKIEVKERPKLEPGVIFRRSEICSSGPPLLEGADLY